MRLDVQGAVVVHYRECSVWMSDWQKLEEVEARIRTVARAASAVDGSRRHVSRACRKTNPGSKPLVACTILPTLMQQTNDISLLVLEAKTG